MLGRKEVQAMRCLFALSQLVFDNLILSPVDRLRELWPPWRFSSFGTTLTFDIEARFAGDVERIKKVSYDRYIGLEYADEGKEEEGNVASGTTISALLFKYCRAGKTGSDQSKCSLY